jgi:hypothetical protein
MLANPNLTPIGNTKKKLEMPPQPGAPGALGAPGMPPGMPTEGAPPAEVGAPPAEGAPPEASPAEAGAPAATTEPLPTEPPKSADDLFSGSATRYKDASLGIENKIPEYDEWDAKAEATTDRWTEILDRSLERLFERQQRVVTEKALGAKARKALVAGTLTTGAVFDKDVWNRQLDEDIRPVLAGIAAEAATLASEQNGEKIEPDNEQIQNYLDDQMARLQKVNDTTESEIQDAIRTAVSFNGENDDDRHLLLKAAVVATFLHLLRKRRRDIAEHEAQTAYNAGTYFSGAGLLDGESDDPNRVVAGVTASEAGRRGLRLQKTWLTQKDARVRPAHQHLHGNSVPFSTPFTVNGKSIRFPGDPLAPPELTMGCRCRLRWRMR